MNDNQKALFGNDFGLIYYPYDFTDAIANHCSYSYTEEQLSSLSEMESIGSLLKTISQFGIKISIVLLLNKIKWMKRVH